MISPHVEVRREAAIHVACVDDDPDILLLTGMALQSIGHLKVSKFNGAHNALRGLEVAPPEVILLDVMMPEMDGPAALREILGNPLLAKIPVIFMTARAQPSEIAGYLALGAAGVIAKPFDPTTLSEEVRRIWRNWIARTAPDDVVNS